MKILMTDESGAVIGDSSVGMLKSIPAFGAAPLHREPMVVFTKSHVKAHTRKDGTFVKDYDTKTQKKAGDQHPWASTASNASRHAEFADGLAKLSAKHGVVVSATGGVTYHGHPDDVKHISYRNDHTSGDLDNNVDDDGVAKPSLTRQFRVDSNDGESVRYSKFTSDLAALSKKTGVSISGAGNVHILENPRDAEGVHYTKDHTSGDIWPVTDDDGNYVKKKAAA